MQKLIHNFIIFFLIFFIGLSVLSITENIKVNQLSKFLFSLQEGGSYSTNLLAFFALLIALAALTFNFIKLENDKYAKNHLILSAKMMVLTIILAMVLVVTPHQELYEFLGKTIYAIFIFIMFSYLLFNIVCSTAILILYLVITIKAPDTRDPLITNIKEIIYVKYIISFIIIMAAFIIYRIIVN